MRITYPELHASRQFQGLILPAHPTSGTEDDDDDRNDERAGENEAPVRAVEEGTEIPEEFEVDDKGGTESRVIARRFEEEEVFR